VYKGRIADGERTRRFRLLLYAGLPDRLHAEVLSPLGRPQLIVDAGGGQLAVTFVREGESFVGPARTGALTGVLGVSLGPDELVRALLLGDGLPAEYRVERSGSASPELPETLTIRSEGVWLELELKRLRPLKTDPTRLGTGTAPVGTRVLPLEQLDGEQQRLEALTEEDGS